ncbi:hypothetical protein [Denitratimonas sp. CY0512]|uniref:hypothetical protein n=1 Tax=Denitratimonas sp. CY0512 TaxID=3131940 RepID=UPI0030A5C1FF
MGNFYDAPHGLGSMSAQELDHIALERGGVVRSIGYGYALTGEVGELPGGWTARWINTQGMGNHGTLVLSPLTARARGVAREGAIRSFERAGLTRLQAQRLYRVKARYKHELVGVLADVLVNPGQVLAMLAHPGCYGFGSGRSEWSRAWGAAFGPEGLGLSAPREAELAKMVSACVG